jgi:hypothetical protein
MSTRTKYTVWIKSRYSDTYPRYELDREDRIWEISESPCTIKQAERISKEIKHDFGCRTVILPEGTIPDFE